MLLQQPIISSVDRIGEHDQHDRQCRVVLLVGFWQALPSETKNTL